MPTAPGARPWRTWVLLTQAARGWLGHRKLLTSRPNIVLIVDQ